MIGLKRLLSSRSFSIAFWSSIGLGLTGIVSILFTILLARKHGSGIFGHYVYALSVSALMATLVQLGHVRTFAVEWVKEPDQRKALLASSIRWRVLSLGLIGLASILWAMIDPGPTTIGSILILLGASFQATHLSAYYDCIGQTQQQVRITTLARLSTLGLASFAVLSTTGDRVLIYIGVSYVLCEGISAVVQFRRAIAFGKLSLSDCFGLGGIQKLVMSNGTVALAALAGLGFVPLTQILLKSLTSVEELGRLGAALIFTRVAFILSQVLQRALRIGIAEAVNAGGHKLKVIFSTHILIVGIFAVICFGPVVLFSDEVAAFVFTEKIPRLGFLLRMGGVYASVLLVGALASQYLISAGKRAMYLTIVVLSSAGNLLLVYLLAPKYGAEGAMIATLACHSSSIACYIAVLRRVTTTRKP